MVDEKLSKERLAICKKCPLWEETNAGPICNPHKWVNKDGKSSYIPKSGYVKGCNCRLRWKTLNSDSHCVAGFW